MAIVIRSGRMPKCWLANHVPGASEAGDDLVDDEENAVPVADLPDDRPVFPRRGADAEGLLDRLADEGHDLARVLELDESLDVPGAGEVARRVGEVQGAPVAVRRLGEDGAGRKRLHHLPDGKNGPQDAQRASGDPVKRPAPR